MKVIVTGGSGFIGGNLVSALLAQDQDVLIYDKGHSKEYPDICLNHDILDRDALEASLKNIDVVYHLAAEHADNVYPASLYYDVNVGGAEKLVMAAEKQCVKKIIFTSTAALYGFNTGVPDEDSPVIPFNDYGKSKYDAEKIIQNWAEKDRKRCAVIVRPVAIFGAGCKGNVYNMLNLIKAKKFIMVGDGKHKKSMGYVENIVTFLATLIEHKQGFHIYNYADKPDMTAREIISHALKIFGWPDSIPRIPVWLGLAGGICFDALGKFSGRDYPISSIRVKKFCTETQVSTLKLEKTGFRAPFTIHEGLKRMIEAEFMRDNESL